MWSYVISVLNYYLLSRRSCRANYLETLWHRILDYFGYRFWHPAFAPFSLLALSSSPSFIYIYFIFFLFFFPSFIILYIKPIVLFLHRSTVQFFYDDISLVPPGCASAKSHLNRHSPIQEIMPLCNKTLVNRIFKILYILIIIENNSFAACRCVSEIDVISFLCVMRIIIQFVLTFILRLSDYILS